MAENSFAPAQLHVFGFLIFHIVKKLQSKKLREDKILFAEIDKSSHHSSRQPEACDRQCSGVAACGCYTWSLQYSVRKTCHFQRKQSWS